MRKFFTIIGMMFLMQNGYSQATETFEFQAKRYFSPSIEQIVSFLEMDFSDWQKAMNEHGFEKTSKPGEEAIYSKGQIGDIIQAISKTDLLVSIDWWNFQTDHKTLTSVRKKLDEFYSHTANNFDFYNYQEYIIGINTSITEYYLMEQILITKK